MAFLRANPQAREHRQLGHEVSGTVVATGPDVTFFKPGDRVVCDPNYNCNDCTWCQQGLPNFCVDRHGVAKGFADYVYPPQSNVYHIPDSLDLEDAAFTEPLSCAIHGIDLLHMQSGMNVALFGMGSVGSLMLQLVMLTGPAKVIVCEREPNKQQIALDMGASMAVDDTQIEDVCKEINADYVIECIGLKSTMEQAIRVAGKNAKVLLFGLGDPDDPISINQYEAFTKELSIYTSYLNPRTTERAVRLLSNGRIDTRSIISAELSLEEMGEELKTRKYSRQGKVMVRLSGEH